MHNEFTGVFEYDEESKLYIGYCVEVAGANGQGKTREDCRKNLIEAIELVLSDRREDALRGVPADAIKETLVLV